MNRWSREGVLLSANYQYQNYSAFFIPGKFQTGTANVTRSHWLKKISTLLKPRINRSISSERYSLGEVIHFTAMVGFASHFLFIFLFLGLGVPTMALVNIVSCLIFAFCFWINARGSSHAALIAGFSEVVIHAYLAVAFLGWNSGFHFYILGLIPLTFYSNSWQPSIKFALAGILCSFYVGLFLFSNQMDPWHYLQPGQLQAVSVMNMVTLFIVFSALAHTYRSAANNSEKAFIQVNKELEYLANTDPLTKLINRRNMEGLIQATVERFHATGSTFSMALGDIDNFKTFNDKYGHEIGDIVLVKAAEILQSSIRGQDIVSRWGGEEFLLLLPNTSEEEAQIIAERLRELIAHTALVHEGKEYSLTMTFGVSTQNCASKTDCIHEADMALLEGKRRGKNCVILWNRNFI
jgi:diguanylate cyclase